MTDTPAIDEVAFDEKGLVPCVVQDWSTGEVLTLAYMNREALERTLSSGETHFWSRSREELWHKGETSGNVQRLRSLRYDCDADALLALVEPAGPACHTGERTCFYRTLGEPRVAVHEALPALARTLSQRQQELPDGSYTTELLRSGPARDRREGPGRGGGGRRARRGTSRTSACAKRRRTSSTTSACFWKPGT